jgi:serine/threonine protein kinase
MKTCPLCDSAYPNQHTNCPTDGAILIETREFAQGMVIRDKYRILRQIGRGGMGTVYLAEHIMLGRVRALKFISSELSQDSVFLRRFRREAQAAIELRHPNIVEVVDLDQAEDGTPYIAMEYVEGPGLRSVLSIGALPVERALGITWGIAQGLAAAHAKGIVHRDVKPENILLAGGNGVPEIPKLLDFGIAAMKETATVSGRTVGLMLTPPYAAPEQWKGMPAEELDGRADIYALGGVLFEMLTGTTPFHAHNTEGWLYQHLYADLQAPSQLRPELQNYPGLDELVLQMLERDREQRFSSAAALLEALAPQLPEQFASAYYDTPRNLSSNIPSQRLSVPVPEMRTTGRREVRTTGRPVAHTTGRPEAYSTGRSDSQSTNSSDSLIFAQPQEQSSKLKWIVAAVVVVLGVGIWLVGSSLGGWIATFTGSKPATEAPVFTLAGGTYPDMRAVGITDQTPSAEIHYTVDGSQPTENSQTYVLPIYPVPSGATVRAIATAEGHAPSSEVSSTYIWSSAPRAASKPAGSATQAVSATSTVSNFYDQAKSAYDNKQFVLARALFKQACDAGDMKACNYLGYLYAQGIGGVKSVQLARGAYGIACDQGTWSGCASLGSIYQEAGDTADARKYFQKACSGGSADGCTLLRDAQ